MAWNLIIGNGFTTLTPANRAAPGPGIYDTALVAKYLKQRTFIGGTKKKPDIDFIPIYGVIDIDRLDQSEPPRYRLLPPPLPALNQVIVQHGVELQFQWTGQRYEWTKTA